jgi:hypothetical protein
MARAVRAGLSWRSGRRAFHRGCLLGIHCHFHLRFLIKVLPRWMHVQFKCCHGGCIQTAWVHVQPSALPEAARLLLCNICMLCSCLSSQSSLSGVIRNDSATRGI